MLVPHQLPFGSAVVEDVARRPALRHLARSSSMRSPERIYQEAIDVQYKLLHNLLRISKDLVPQGADPIRQRPPN